VFSGAWDQVVVVDDHYYEHGLGMRLASVFAQEGLRVRVRSLALQEIPVSGQTDEALRYHKMDADSIVKFVQE